MKFSVMFFSADSADHANLYGLLKEAVIYADQNGFDAVWTPERHFHPFGGSFPNPAVTGAAISAWTERIAIRAGSVVVPLHDPIRIVEEWAMVDQLSGGRAALSVAVGWNVNDFVFFPDRFAERREITDAFIEEIRHLWRVGVTTRKNGMGNQVDVNVLPRPVQAELPMWLTASSRTETFEAAGRMGLNLLTQLSGQSFDGFDAKVAAYRQARRAAGHDPSDGTVTLMMHTAVGKDREQIRNAVRAPLKGYLKRSLQLEMAATKGQGGRTPLAVLTGSGTPYLDEMLERAFQRYFDDAGMLGTVDDCRRIVQRLQRLGVDEVACLVDFGPSPEAVLESLESLAPLVRENSA